MEKSVEITKRVPYGRCFVCGTPMHATFRFVVEIVDLEVETPSQTWSNELKVTPTVRVKTVAQTMDHEHQLDEGVTPKVGTVREASALSDAVAEFGRAAAGLDQEEPLEPPPGPPNPPRSPRDNPVG